MLNHNHARTGNTNSMRRSGWASGSAGTRADAAEGWARPPRRIITRSNINNDNMTNNNNNNNNAYHYHTTNDLLLMITHSIIAIRVVILIIRRVTIVPDLRAEAHDSRLELHVRLEVRGVVLSAPR